MPNAFRGALLGLGLIVLWVDAARSADLSGKVVGVSGECFVESDGKRVPLKLNGEVRVGDTVDVPANAKLKLRMNDGSILSVAAGSQLTINTYAVDADGKRSAAALTLGEGLIHAVVAPVEHPAAFEVSTAVGTAGTRSTDWFIEAQPGSTVVGVLVGSVALKSNGSGAEVVIPAHSGASVTAGADPTAPRVWRQAEFNALIVRSDLSEPRPPRSVHPTERRQEYNPAPNSEPEQPAPYYPAPRGNEPTPYYPNPDRYNPPSRGYNPPSPGYNQPYPGANPQPGNYGR